MALICFSLRTSGTEHLVRCLFAIHLAFNGPIQMVALASFLVAEIEALHNRALIAVETSGFRNSVKQCTLRNRWGGGGWIRRISVMVFR